MILKLILFPIFIIPLICIGLVMAFRDYDKKRDWMSDREDYYQTSKVKKVNWPLERQKAMGNECRYCGYEYKNPKYCSVFGRTADKHEWL